MQTSKQAGSRLKAAVEILAEIGPIICLVDCIVIPAMLVLLPLVGIHQIFHGVGDQILTVAVLAICAPGLFLRYLRHKRLGILAMSALGFSFVFFANFAGHALDEGMHIAITIAGSFLLIGANRVSGKLSNHCSCHHERETA